MEKQRGPTISFFVLGFLLSLLSVVHGNGNGAPLASCSTMGYTSEKAPYGHYFRPQASSGPFSIKPSQTYMANSESINVVLSGDQTSNPDDPISGLFSGYMLMAFDYYNEEDGPIGTFSDINPNSAQYLPCFNKSFIAVTHRNPNLKQNVTVKWSPPSGFIGRVVFRASVSETFKIFYQRIPSPVIDILAEVSTTTTQSTSTTTRTSTTPNPTTAAETTPKQTTAAETTPKQTTAATTPTTAATTTDGASRSVTTAWAVSTAFLFAFMSIFIGGHNHM